MKKRKFNILLNIAVLCMCVAAIAIGVYSAKTASLNVSGTIGFTAHNCKVDITGYIYGHATGNEPDGAPVTLEDAEQLNSGNALSVSGANSSLPFGDRYFSDMSDSGNVEDIVIVLTLTNVSKFNVLVDVDVPTLSNIDVLCDNDLVVLYTDVDKTATVSFILRMKKDANGVYQSLTSLENVNLSINFSKVPEFSSDGFTISGNTITDISIPTNSDNESSDVIYIPSKFSDNESIITTIGEYAGFNGKLPTGKKLVILKGITTISYNAFAFADLVKIALPSTISSIGTTALPGNNFTSLNVPARLKSIGNDSFRQCNNLKIVKLYEGLEVIGENTFSYCSNLQTAVLPSTIKTISRGAFMGCSNLNVSIPNGCTTIGYQAFEGSAIENLLIPNTITSIGYNAFAGIKTLQTVVFESGTDSLNCDNTNGGMFSACTNLKNVTFSNRNTSTPGFDNCEKLTYISLKDSNITKINNGSFQNCKNLNKVELNSNIVEIDGAAFNDCIALTDINIDECTKLTYIGDLAFNGCSNLNISIPASCTTIGASAFKGTAITTLTIPAKVTSIGTTAFAGTNLSKVIIESNNIEGIGENLFDNCTQLKTIKFANSVSTLDTSLLDNCKSYLTTIDLGDSNVTTIPENAFQKYTNLQTVILNTETTSIGRNSFNSCTQLKNINIANCNKLLTIDDVAFQNCESLNVSIPANVVSIGAQAFAHTAITTLNIPASVTRVGDGAFSNTQLQTVTFASGSTTINLGIDTFHTCKNLSKITFSDRVTALSQSMFYACDSLTTITIPKSVTSLGIKVFRKCANLQTVSFESGTTINTISGQLFSNCAKLNNLIIPISVTKIEANAFEGCTSLTNVTFADTSKTWSANSVSLSVASPATNATNLTNTYLAYAWTKNS